MMKAVVITRFGGPEVLAVEERPIPEPGAGQVLLQVHAAGINRPDVFQRKGNYPVPAGATADIPGLEVAGIVHAVGAGVSRWRVGDRVCALLAGGGYAAYAVAEAGHCLPIPQGISFAEAACVPETVFTVWHNVFQRGQLQKGDGLLVHGGSGGIGTTAIQLAHLRGAHVYTTAGTDEKCAACLGLGATRSINYRTADFGAELAGERINVVLDSIGGDYFDKNVDLLAPEGRLVYINATQGRKVSLNLVTLMQKRIVLTGSTLRARDDDFKTALCQAIESEVWPLWASGQFRPVVYRTLDYTQATEAHRLLESGEVFGKLVMTLM